MKQPPGKIGIREYVSIAILMLGAKATEDTPALLYSDTENAAWMVPIIVAIISFVPLSLLMKTMALFQNKDLFTVIQKLLGKYFGFLICLIILITSTLTISLDSRTYTDIIRANYFNTTPTLIIYSVLLFVSAYGAKKGIQHIGSVAYLIIFYAIIFLFIGLLLGLQDSNIQALLPIWGPGIPNILINSSQKLSLFSDFLLLAMVIPFQSSRKVYQKGTWIAYVYIVFQLTSAILIYICLFDTSLGGIGYPYHTAIRYVSLGNYLPNVEIIFFVIWMLGAYIRFTVFLYINGLMFGRLFKIKDFEYLIPSLAVLYLLIGIIPETPLEVSVELKPFLRNVGGPMFVAVSIILWLTALLKGEFKHAKDKNSL